MSCEKSKSRLQDLFLEFWSCIFGKQPEAAREIGIEAALYALRKNHWDINSAIRDMNWNGFRVQEAKNFVRQVAPKNGEKSIKQRAKRN